MTTMTESQFWQRATDIFNLYDGRYRKCLLTEEEQREDIISYLTDMDTLFTDWRSREAEKQKERP